MCGAALDPEARERACRGCPLRALTKGCRLGLVRCPVCGYHSLAREAHGPKGGWAPSIAPSHRLGSGPKGRARSKPNKLNELPPGAEAHLAGFNGLWGPDVKRLLAYGLVPGVRVRVLQKSPAVVLRVGETELALEEALAASIEVEVVRCPVVKTDDGRREDR